jgi:SAM-dependent methyltransferase
MDNQIASKIVEHNIGKYPHCKILGYYISHLKNIRSKKPYKSITSKKQISTIIAYAKKHKAGLAAYHRLVGILAKHVQSKNYSKILDRILTQKLSDDKIYSMIHTKYPNKVAEPLGCDLDIRRAQLYGHILLQLPNKIRNYLDFGCVDCRLTTLLGKELGLKSDFIHGVHNLEWGFTESKHKDRYQISMIPNEESKLPFKIQSFDLISCFMVLHHVKDLTRCLINLHRMLRPNGYLIIRDHDASDNLDYMLADIEHVSSVSKDSKIDYKSYHTRYYDRLEWDYIFHLLGFEYQYSDYDYDRFPNNMTPTRTFCAIYQKV